jgi:predicted amidophosphoribosyltransferase
MQIIWNQEAADRLKNSHTVLELETFEVRGSPITTYCVLSADQIPLEELLMLGNYIELHAGFVKAMKENDYKLCKDISEHLLGKFSGELDSFYEIILEKLKV